MLGTELGSYGRAINAHTFKKQKTKKMGDLGKESSISPTPKFHLFLIYLSFFFFFAGWGEGVGIELKPKASLMLKNA